MNRYPLIERKPVQETQPHLRPLTEEERKRVDEATTFERLRDQITKIHGRRGLWSARVMGM